MRKRCQTSDANQRKSILFERIIETSWTDFRKYSEQAENTGLAVALQGYPLIL